MLLTTNAKQNVLTPLRFSGSFEKKCNRASRFLGPGICIFCIISFIVAAWDTYYENCAGRSFLRAAKHYLHAGRTQLALNELTLAVGADESRLEALQMRAAVYQQLSDLAKAQADFCELSRLQPYNATWPLEASKCAFKQAKFDESLEWARTRLKSAPNDNTAKALVVACLAQQGACSEALMLAGNVDEISLPPYLVSPYFEALGVSARVLGYDKTAITYFNKALSAGNRSEDILDERADAFLSIKDYKHATADRRELARLYPAHHQHHAKLGAALMLEKQYAPAITELAKAAAFEPKPEYFEQIARCNLMLNQYGRAVAACNSGLTIEPSSPSLALLRASALRKAKLQRAIVTVQPHELSYPSTEQRSAKTKESKTDQIIFRRRMAEMLMRLQRPEQAFEQYTYLSSVNALGPEEKLLYAQCADRVGKTERAMELYFEILKRNPNAAEARSRLVELLQERGLYAKAKEILSAPTASSLRHNIPNAVDIADHVIIAA